MNFATLRRKSLIFVLLAIGLTSGINAQIPKNRSVEYCHTNNNIICEVKTVPPKEFKKSFMKLLKVAL